MATPRFAWGIDIGNRALKAVRLANTADGLVIEDYDIVEHDTVLSASGDNRDQLVQSALATFVARHPGIDKGQVGVSVNSQRTFAKFVKLPPVEAKRIPEIVKFEAVQQIPFSLDEVEWSYHLFQEPASPDVEVGIFAMKKGLVNEQIKYFTDAKLDVQVVQTSPLAVYNALYYDSRIKGTTMVVDLGAESTDLIIAEGEGVWLRSIPIGGNNFTEALTKPFRVDFDKAEELKRTSRTSKYSRQIVQHMRPVFADLVSEIQRSMGFYTSTHKESRIDRVIALGNTFRLPGLQRYLQQNLTLEVRELSGIGTAVIEDANQAALLNENLLSSVGAYGLALQVMGQGKIGSSLLPEQIRQQKMWREKNKWFAAAAACFVAGTAVAYGSYYVADASAKSVANQGLQQQITSLEGQAGKLSSDWDQKVEQAGAGDLKRVENVKHLVDGQGVWPQINADLHDALPQFAPDVPPGVAAGDVAALKKIPRDQRPQIIINALTSHYVPDLQPALDATDLTSYADANVDTLPTNALSPDAQPGGFPGGGVGGLGMGLGGEVAAAPTKAKRGYVLTLKCSTPAPNTRAAELFNRYSAALSAIKATPAHPFKFIKARVIRLQPVSQDARRMADMAAAYTAVQKQKQAAATGGSLIGQAPDARPDDGRGGPPVFNPGQFAPGLVGGGGANGVPDEAYQDPQLGEDVRADTQAVIVIVVELDVTAEPPASPPSGGTPAPVAPPLALPGMDTRR